MTRKILSIAAVLIAITSVSGSACADTPSPQAMLSNPIRPPKEMSNRFGLKKVQGCLPGYYYCTLANCKGSGVDGKCCTNDQKCVCVEQTPQCE